MKIGTTRLETISDGVIAIVITIMVLELKLPDLNGDEAPVNTYQHLHALLPYFVTYAFSFMMIGIFWTNHHHMFHLLETTDEHLVWQNFIFLFLVSLVPFATGVVGANPLLPLSPAIYGGLMMLTTLSFLLMRNYSMRKKLLHRDQDEELSRNIVSVSVKARRKGIIGALIYALSVPLSFVSVYIAYALFIIPPILFFIPEGIDNEKLAEKVAKKNVS